MKKTVKIILLIAALLLLAIPVLMLVNGPPWMDSFFDSATLVMVICMFAAACVALISKMVLVYRLLLNLFPFILNRLFPEDAKPLRPLKRPFLSFVISISLIFAIYWGANAFLSLKPSEPDDPAKYGSFTSKTAVSSDGRYSAKQVVTRPHLDSVEMVRVDVYDNETGELVDSFLTERAWDFWGICWEEGTYNIWIQSGDVGVYCFEETNGEWEKNYDLPLPDSIISPYDPKQTESIDWSYPLPE